jgi:hypothetical protein
MIRIFIASSIVILSLFTAAPALADAPDQKGQPRATEPRTTVDPPETTGKPTNPDGWGSVVSDFADLGIMGSHSSQFSEPRDGLGNVARNDGEPGDDLGSHGEFAARMAQTQKIAADATDKPGN